MKYQFFYQTKENENRDGWITAKNRAEAYAALRKQGIRPYRVVGDDPVPWQPWAIGALVALLTLGLIAALLFRTVTAEETPLRRGQLAGDPARIEAGQASAWSEVFPLALDRYLALYAQPGWKVARPAVSGEEAARLVADLEAEPPAVGEEDDPEIRQLKGIVKAMRGEMKEYLASGGTIADYLDFLELRQKDEESYRDQAVEHVRSAPDSLRDRARINMNVRLREMGLAEIGE